MTPSEMLYEVTNDLLFPFLAYGLLVRLNNLEIGALGAAVGVPYDWDMMTVIREEKKTAC
jgi:hypothetical protein